MHSYFGPIQLNKNGDPNKRFIVKFFEAVVRWQELTEKERETFRVERCEE
jgi:hypothetical protein